jgi:hypothetical protein
MRCIPLTTSLSPKVYYRRKFKARKRNTSRANQDKVPIFGQSVIHNSALEVDQGGNISTHKRKPTPAAVTKLDAMMVTSPPPQAQGARIEIRKSPQA